MITTRTDAVECFLAAVRFINLQHCDTSDTMRLLLLVSGLVSKQSRNQLQKSVAMETITSSSSRT